MPIRSKLKKFLKEEDAFFKKNNLKTAVSLVAMASVSLMPVKAAPYSGTFVFDYSSNTISVRHTNHGSH